MLTLELPRYLTQSVFLGAELQLDRERYHDRDDGHRAHAQRRSSNTAASKAYTLPKPSRIYLI
jgi:hypothetical protein